MHTPRKTDLLTIEVALASDRAQDPERLTLTQHLMGTFYADLYERPVSIEFREDPEMAPNLVGFTRHIPADIDDDSWLSADTLRRLLIFCYWLTGMDTSDVRDAVDVLISEN